jgi:hypothetical protein
MRDLQDSSTTSRQIVETTCATFPEVNGWSEHQDEEGKTYWHCPATGVSTWDDPHAALKPRTIYTSSFDTAVKSLKFISVSSCSCTLLAAPALIALGDDTLPMAGRCFLAVALSGFGMFSTGVVHWITRPHVSTIVAEPLGAVSESADGVDGTEAPKPGTLPEADYDCVEEPKLRPVDASETGDVLLTATTRNLLGQKRHVRFRSSEIQPKMLTVHPFASFSAGGENFHVRTEDVDHVSVRAALESVAEKQKGGNTNEVKLE